MKVDPGFPNEDDNFAANLRHFREHRGLTQAQLAENLSARGLENFHPTTISRIESGARPVRLSEAKTIAAALDSSVTLMTQSPWLSENMAAFFEWVEDATKAALDAGRAGYDFMVYTSFLRSEIDTVQAAVENYGEDVDPQFVTQVKSYIARAQRLIDASLQDEINKYIDAFESGTLTVEYSAEGGEPDGVDSETS